MTVVPNRDIDLRTILHAKGALDGWASVAAGLREQEFPLRERIEILYESMKELVQGIEVRKALEVNLFMLALMLDDLACADSAIPQHDWRT